MIPQAMKKKRGVFLTLDMVLGLLLMFSVIIAAWYYFGAPASKAFNSMLLRSYMQDAATVMARQGAFSQPFTSATNTNTTLIREALRKTPPSACIQVAAYGLTVRGSLAGYWKLDEATGAAAADSSGNANTGVIGGNISYLENGRIGRAFLFDGSSASVNITDSEYLNPVNDSFSIALWFNASATQKQALTPTLFGKYSTTGGIPGYHLYYDNSTGRPYACYYINYIMGCNGGLQTVTTDSSVKGSGWNHVAVTFNRSNGNVLMYLNGAVQAANATGFDAVAQVNNTENAWIGADFAAGSIANQFSSAIDDVRFYKKALNPDEVAQIYSNGWNLAYVVNKDGCPLPERGADVQTLTFTFSDAASQDTVIYYTMAMKAWYKGASG